MPKAAAKRRATARRDRSRPLPPMEQIGGIDTAVCRMQKMRKNSITAAQKDHFFELLSETSNVTQSAAAAGIALPTVKKYRKTDARFAERWNQALADGIADLRMRALAQARFGEHSVHRVREGDGERITHVVQDIANRALRHIDRFGAAAILHDEKVSAAHAARDEGVAIVTMLRLIELELHRKVETGADLAEPQVRAADAGRADACRADADER